MVSYIKILRGVVFKSARTVLIDVNVTVRKFYASANAILSHVNYASYMLKLFFNQSINQFIRHNQIHKYNNYDNI